MIKSPTLKLPKNLQIESFTFEVGICYMKLILNALCTLEHPKSSEFFIKILSVLIIIYLVIPVS